MSEIVDKGASKSQQSLQRKKRTEKLTGNSNRDSILSIDVFI